MTETTSDTTNNTSTQIFTDTRIHRIPQSRILLAFSIFYAKQETKFSCEVGGLVRTTHTQHFQTSGHPAAKAAIQLIKYLVCDHISMYPIGFFTEN